MPSAVHRVAAGAAGLLVVVGILSCSVSTAPVGGGSPKWARPLASVAPGAFSLRGHASLASVRSPSPEVARKALALLDTSPALFVENVGQCADPSIRFVHAGKGANILLTDEGPVFQLFRREGDGPEVARKAITFRARFEGARTVRPEGADPAPSRFNYYLGSDHSRRRTGVHSFRCVTYRDLYPGIDLHVFGRRSHLKYEFHVAPGADPSQIVIRYEGIDGLSQAEDGSLCVRTELGELIDDAPVIYQEIAGRRAEVPGAFALEGREAYGFRLLASYDGTAELIIDPDLAWSTYLGGSAWDRGRGIVADSAGNLLVTGETESSGWVTGGFDTTLGGSTDAFVVKLSPDGAHLWSTYLGGSAGDLGEDIAVDGEGNVLVTGSTGSAGWVTGGFDTTLGGSGDAFLAKLSPDGAHLWSTYLGGSAGDGGRGVAVDGAGNVLVAGLTNSSGWVSGGFDTSYNGGAHDAFVAKLSPEGAHLWSTYLGGSWIESGRDIAVDGVGNVVVTGYTNSYGWVSGGYDTTFGGDEEWSSDGFVAKLSAEGAHLWSTYLGGWGDERGEGIAVDSAGNVLVTGYTMTLDWASGGFDTTHNGDHDAFVVKLSAGGAHVWSTYLGGSERDYGVGIAADGAGNILVTGYTQSAGWVSGGFDTTHNGSDDAFVVKLSADGAHQWSTYLGGPEGDAGWGIAAGRSDSLLVTGYTISSGWVSGGFDTSYNGGSCDGFVAKIGPSAALPPTGVSASDGDHTDKVEVTWDASAEATSCEVWRHTSDDSASATQIASSVAATSYDDTSAAPGVLYYYWVKASNALGSSDFSSSDSGYRAVPPPSGVAATDGAYPDKVRVTWNPADGATSYEVWRHTSDSSASATRIASSVAGTSLDDTSALPGTTFYYWLKANYPAGTSGFSSSDFGYCRVVGAESACVDNQNTTGQEDGTAQHPFNTIQEGIDAVGERGTVKVARGTYDQNLAIRGKKLTILGGYHGGTYPGTGDFAENNRDPNPATNQTVIDGGGTGAAILCQDAAARGSALMGLSLRNGGARFRGGVVLKRVIARPGP